MMQRGLFPLDPCVRPMSGDQKGHFFSPSQLRPQLRRSRNFAVDTNQAGNPAHLVDGQALFDANVEKVMNDPDVDPRSSC